MLQRFLLDDRLPERVLAGSLADLGYPIPYTCALPPPEDRALSDVWSALGGELKPSLDLVVIAPFDLGRQIPIAPPVLEGPQLVVAGADGGKRRKGRSAKTAAADAESTAEPPAADAGAAGATEERAGGRQGNVGRRLVVTELPR
jgi:hypothetical protein